MTVGYLMHLVVTEFEPGRRLAWKTVVDGDDTGSSAYHGWVITPTATGCHVLTEETQQGPWFLEVLGHQHPGGLYSYHQQWVEELARAAEAEVAMHRRTAMIIDLNGRKAIVTGSTAGIGRAIAEGLARAGAAVVINGRSEERVAQAVQEVRALFPDADITGVRADVATAEGSAALAAAVPEADILINNAGTARPNDFFGQDDSEWLDLFQLNVMSGVRATRHYIPGMTKRGWGRVVFISSESAINIPKEMIDYGMTKTAMLAVARGLAELVGGSGVTVNAVLPGPTNSEILSNWMKATA